MDYRNKEFHLEGLTFWEWLIVTINYPWKCGWACPIRYAIGEFHERLFGYGPEGTQLQYRVARWLGLSGY